MTLPFPIGFLAGDEPDLTAPTGLTVSIATLLEPFTARTDTLTVTWTDQSTDENNWEVFRKKGPGGTYGLVAQPGTSNKAGTGGTETYVDSSAKDDDQDYFYKVRAVKNVSFKGPFGNEDSEFTDAATPGAAVFTTGYPKDDTADDDAILIRADGSLDATHRDLYAKVGSTMSGDPVTNGTRITGAGIPNASIVGVDFDHDDQAPTVNTNDLVFYQMRAYKVGSNGNKVATVFNAEKSETALIQVPGTPSITSTVVDSVTQITLNWNPGSPDTAVDYRIQSRKREPSGSFDAYADESPKVAASPKTFSTLEGKEYQVRVRGENASGESTYDEGAVVETFDPPTAPTGVAATSDNKTEFTVTWNQGGGTIDTTQIRHRVTSPPGSYITQTDADNASPHTVTGKTERETYDVQVRHQNDLPADPDTAWTPATPITVCVSQTPGVPTSPAAALTAPTHSTIRVTFVAPTGGTVDSYKVQARVKTPQGSFVDYTGSASPVDATGLDPDETYELQVRSENNCGLFSTYVPIVLLEATTDKAPGPTNITLVPKNATDTTVTIDYDAVTDATAYEVWLDTADLGADPTSAGTKVATNPTDANPLDVDVNALIAATPNDQVWVNVRAIVGGSPQLFGTQANGYTHVEKPNAFGQVEITTGCPGQLDVQSQLDHDNTGGDDRTEGGTSEIKSATTQAGLSSATYGDSTAFSASAATVTHTNVNQSDSWFQTRAKYTSESVWDETGQNALSCPA